MPRLFLSIDTQRHSLTDAQLRISTSQRSVDDHGVSILWCQFSALDDVEVEKLRVGWQCNHTDATLSNPSFSSEPAFSVRHARRVAHRSLYLVELVFSRKANRQIRLP